MKTRILTTVAAAALLTAGTTGANAGSCGDHGKASTTKAGYSETSGAALATEQTNIVETAQAAGAFNTLLAAAEAAGLVETLAGEGPLTVFAPTDEAFARLPEGTIEALLEDQEKLTAILTYHVVSGAVTASEVVTLESATSVNGAELAIRTKGDNVFIEGAKVVQADIICDNGVIHVIDQVMIPN